MSKQPRRCSITGCKTKHYAKGLCATHWMFWRRTGDPMPDRTRGTCKIEDCWGDVKGRDLCSKHYQRVMKHGNPHHTGRVAPPCVVEGCKEKNWSLGYCSTHYAKFRRHGDPTWERPKHCAMGNCWKKPHGLGLCITHYFRYRKWSDPWFDGKNYPECTVEGCVRAKVARGMCQSHHAQFLRYGDPTISTGAMGVRLPIEPIEEILRRFAEGGPASYYGPVANILDHAGIENRLERERVETYLSRSIKRGWIDLAQADHFAVKICGTHPALIWPEDYWQVEDEEEEEEVLAA